MQREDEWGKAVSEITIYVQATLSVFANKDCIEDALLMSASEHMPKWDSKLTWRATKLLKSETTSCHGMLQHS
jgi:hypothetical protein